MKIELDPKKLDGLLKEGHLDKDALDSYLVSQFFLLFIKDYLEKQRSCKYE